MKSNRLASNLLVIAAALILGQPVMAQEGTAPAAANLPRIAVSQEEFNFGRVAQGASISHVFWIKNVGGDILRITDVKPG
jgi:hypothetical protein